MTSYAVEGPRSLRGHVRVPGDKSISHRALLLASLAAGESTVRGLSDGDDVARTRAAISALGARVDDVSGGVHITGGALREPDHVIDVGNSGTAIRLLAGVVASHPFLTVLQGDRSIAGRPMDRVAEPLRRMGASVDGRSGGSFPPLVIRGGDLVGVEHVLPVATAQVKSAILLAGLRAKGETVVVSPAPSRAHTEEMLAQYGADVTSDGDGLRVAVRPSELRPFDLDVPGDPSQAAFWIVGACIVPGSDVTVDNVYLGPARNGFLDVLVRMGADIEIDEASRSVRARYAPLQGTVIEPDEIPSLVDEIPILAVAAALAEGTTTVLGAAELRVKESDRIATITSELSSVGGVVTPTDDGLVVEGREALTGGAVRSSGDHRIAMAMAIAGLAATGPITIDGWDAVGTSYPTFAAHLQSLTA